MEATPPSGLLLIDKPSGWTSFDVVAKVRGIIKRESGLKKPKVGHTGTLDPLATGLLVLTVGSYCKRAGEFTKLDKVYDVTITLGQTSTTDDEEGQKTAVSDMQPSLQDVTAALKHFTGTIQQVPPAFSAIKVNGQRSYKLARGGTEVVLEARPVTVHDIWDVSYDYPNLTFKASVSSGTYIRSLARDIGEYLGTGAYMSGLRRESVGEFKLADALATEGLEMAVISSRLLSK